MGTNPWLLVYMRLLCQGEGILFRDNDYCQSRKFPDTTYNSKVEAVLKTVLYFAGNKQF